VIKDNDLNGLQSDTRLSICEVFVAQVKQGNLLCMQAEEKDLVSVDHRHI
jgi:hypothetical protein